jgi:hypothetical protein
MKSVAQKNGAKPNKFLGMKTVVFAWNGTWKNICQQ